MIENNSAEVTAKSQDRPKKPKLPLRKRLLKTTIFLLYVLVLLEVGSRVYWMVKRDLPFFATQQDFYDRFYEEIKDSGVREADLAKDNGHFDVLLLGGSAMDRIARSLAEDSEEMASAFGELTDQPVRVYNLAAPALTTRDSLIKYQLMGDLDKHFDLVVVYHGINDLRMNNIAPDRFESDYTHSGWYCQINRMQAYGRLLSVWTVPYTCEYTVLHILSSKKLDVFIPRHKLNTDWMQYGEDIKTAGPFAKNLRQIAAAAKQRGEPLALVTFAWHMPEDYTVEALRADKLDYSGEVPPDAVENWGTPAAVRKGMAVHNGIVRNLGATHPDVMLVDVEPAIEKSGAMFNDVCHLSEAGKREWLKCVAPALKDNLSQTEE